MFKLERNATQRNRNSNRTEALIRQRSKLFWTTICTIGFLITTYQITDLYLQWEIYADYVNYPSEDIYTPALTLCFDALRLPNYGPCPNSTCLETTESFFANLIPFENLISIISIVNEKGEVFKYDTVESFANFLNRTTLLYKFNRYACFHIDFINHINQTHYKRAYVETAELPMLFTIQLKRNLKALLVFIGSRDDRPNLVNSIADAKIGLFQTMVWTRTEINLLPPPFKTRCRNYKLEGFANQKECYHRCTIDWAIEHDTKIPTATPRIAVDNHTLETRDPLKNLNSSRLPYIAHCMNQCRQVACLNELYTSRTVQKFRGQTMIMLLAPTEPDIVINYRPKLVFAEFMALWSSLVGLWYGLSAFSFFVHSQDLVLKGLLGRQVTFTNVKLFN